MNEIAWLKFKINYNRVGNLHISHYVIRTLSKIFEFIIMLHIIAPIVAYWPRPSCQKKKCTCVNNRCIRSKISNQGRPWLSRIWIECEIVTLAGSRWATSYYITLVTGSSDQLERRCWNEKHIPPEAGPPGPQAAGWAAQENRKETLLWP